MTTVPQTSAQYLFGHFLSDFWSFLRPYKGKFIFATLCRLAADLAWLYPAFGLASLINFFTDYQSGESLSAVWYIFFFFGIVIIVRALGMYFAKFTAFSLGERMGLDAQVRSIEHISLLDMAWHERQNTGNKLKRILRGTEGFDRIIRMWIGNAIEITVNIVGVLFIFTKFDPVITLFSVVAIFVYYAVAWSFISKAKEATRVVNEKEEDMHGILFEILNGIRSVKVLGMGSALLSIIRGEAEVLWQKIRKRIFWFQVGNNTRGLVGWIFQYGMGIYIVFGIAHGQYELGFLILFFNYFGKILTAAEEFASVTEDFVIAKMNIGRMMEVLREPITIDTDVGKAHFPRNWRTISIRNLSFAYGDNMVLRGVSFDIRRGERVGIVGLSGGGKSTLFKLLLKEHENYEGDILVDSIPLRDIDKREYFTHATAVLQDTEVFNFSLRENVTLANNKEVENVDLFNNALHVSHVEDFLKKLPEGADTLIGEKGVKLSGGERQRLGIARAIFKRPEILFLDEATSHLDIESEEKIRTSLHEFFQRVTAVVIAHRLTTIREMDRIIVLEEGVIIEEGTFDHLYAKRGRFFELWEKQRL